MLFRKGINTLSPYYLSGDYLVKAYDISVINAVLGMSVSKDYNQAKTEWNFTGDVVDHGFIKDQKPVAKCNFCGHPVRYGYILRNSKNSKKVEVGSECVENFMNVTLNVQNKMDLAKKNIAKKQKADARKAVLAALNEANKVVDEVFKSKNYKDRDRIGAAGNNEWVLYDYIKDGRLFEMAKKYSVNINMDRFNAFLKVYKQLK